MWCQPLSLSLSLSFHLSDDQFQINVLSPFPSERWETPFTFNFSVLLPLKEMQVGFATCERTWNSYGSCSCIWISIRCTSNGNALMRNNYQSSQPKNHIYIYIYILVARILTICDSTEILPRDTRLLTDDTDTINYSLSPSRVYTADVLFGEPRMIKTLLTTYATLTAEKLPFHHLPQLIH